MTFYALAALINAITSLTLGSLIFFKNRKNTTNYTFILLSGAVFFWSLFYFLWQISTDHDTALLYTRLLSIGSTFIPVFYLHWVLSFLDIKTIKAKIVLWFGYIATLVFLSFSFSPLFIKDVEKMLVFDFWPKAGILYSIYLLVSYGGLVGFGLIELIRNYSRSNSLKQYQIRYIIVGTIIGFLGGATNFFLWYNVNILPFGNVITSLYVFILFYAMVRYRLMDIRVVVQKIFIYLMVSFFTYIAFYAIIGFYNRTFGGVFNSASYAFGIILAPSFVWFFYSIDRAVRVFANKYLFVSLYNYQETINRLIAQLNNYIDLDKIIKLIVDTIKDTMQLDKAGVLLVNTKENPIKYQIAKVIGFNEKNGISLVQDNFLTKYLAKTQKPLVSDELIILSNEGDKKDEKNLLRLYIHMREIEAALCLPLMSNKKLIGIIVLGSKISGDAYTDEDLKLLDILSKQASIAIENARQYKEIEDFGKTLKNKVDEQTKNIEKQKEYLQELLNMKSDFLRVVNHQLNTPLSIMRGYFSMMRDGDYPPEKAIPIIESGLDRIIDTVSAFWDAYKLEGEKMKMEPEKVSMSSLVTKMIKEKKELNNVKTRKLKLEVEKPDFKIPDVWCDLQKITHVISNLLDNAVNYTYKGKIVVSYELDNGFLKINVKDTGAGISEEDRIKIFQKFSRSSSALKMNPNGSGLGLYVAKKIVEGNGGEISFYSRGENQGTTFSFTIPIYKNQEETKVLVNKPNKIEIF
ncbi:MAG: ATP-binding protein [Candidatus Paceibacterota bacterium]|jgi:signal transduction histidine kinase